MMEWWLAVISISLAIFLLCLAILGGLFSTQLARQAIKSKGNIVRLWKAACLAQSFYVWAILLTALSIVFLLQLITQWFDRPEGLLLGVSITVGLLTTAMWELTQHTPNVYWDKIQASLTAALPRSGEAREIFNAKKSQLSSADPVERNNFLQAVLNPESNPELIMGEAKGSGDGARGEVILDNGEPQK